MNRDYKITHEVRTSTWKGDEPVNTGRAQKLNQDRNALTGTKTYPRLADFYRVVPRELLEKDLFTVIVKGFTIEGHTIQEYEPVGMIEDTKIKLFGKELSGEVHYDGIVIQLVKGEHGNLCHAVVDGELPDFITGVTTGTWSTSKTLREALIRMTTQHYGSLRQKPTVVHETYSEAMKAQAYDQAYSFLVAGLKALELHAFGEIKLTQDDIKAVVAMLNSANGAPKFQEYISKANQ